MENNRSRRLIVITGIVVFFSILVLVWYFLFSTPTSAPTLGGTNNPLRVNPFPKQFQFLHLWGDTSSTSTTEVIDPLSKPLIEIWDKPATGQTFTTEEVLKEVTSTTTTITGGTTTVTEVKKTLRATSTSLFFVDKTTGYIYKYKTETGDITQVSNTVVPGVYDAYFFNNGTRVIMRYADTEKNKVVSFIGDVPSVSNKEAALPIQNMQYLTGEVISVALNARKDIVSYVVAGDAGSSVYTITQKGRSFVASSPLKEWLLSYGGDVLFATTKPSAYVEGITVTIPSFEAEFDSKSGLMSNAGPSGLVLNSMWTDSGLKTFFSNNGNLSLLPFSTLASKCAWSEKAFLFCAVPQTLPKGTEGLPDDWLQGRVSFSDDLFFVDKNTSQKYALYSFTKDDGIFDVTDITISKENDLLSFNKKQNATLWLLNTNLIKGQ